MRRLRLGLILLFATTAHAAAPALSALEHHVRAYHEGARGALREGASCLEEDHDRWLARVRANCRNDSCRGTAYLDRLAELHALQPGVTAIRHFQLPRRPELVWILPPTADTTAAPRNRKAVSTRVEGSILDEVANGDGFILRTSRGERYLLGALMFLEGSSAQRLSLMAMEPGARFIARGHAAPGRSRTKAFEPNRCVFIYRVAS